MKLSATILLVLLYASSLAAFAETREDSISSAALAETREDSVSLQGEKVKKPGFFKRLIDNFSVIDENYIEPQHYLYTVMAQATYSYDVYTLRSDDDVRQSIILTSDGSLKIGPYFGWQFLFAGYTFAISAKSYNKTKTEIDLSFYTSRLGIDLFYRRTGCDYKLRVTNLGSGVEDALHNVSFDGVSAGITGLNLYYIFNHRRFSYPAAFSQSTCQKISCGSWMAGIGHTRNTISLDYEKLQRIIDEKLGAQTVELDSGLRFKSASYFDISLSGGYAYNIVFAKNFLLCLSGQFALSYKETYGRNEFTEHNFSFRNFSPNIIGRFALVFNNTRWYAGLSAIVRSNTYMDSHFSTNNTFGNVNMYVGYNFGLKKRYKNKKS
jgi:hypothetical protein